MSVSSQSKGKGRKLKIPFVMATPLKLKFPMKERVDKEEDSALPICFSFGEEKGLWLLGLFIGFLPLKSIYRRGCVDSG